MKNLKKDHCKIAGITLLKIVMWKQTQLPEGQWFFFSCEKSVLLLFCVGPWWHQPIKGIWTECKWTVYIKHQEKCTSWCKRLKCVNTRTIVFVIRGLKDVQRGDLLPRPTNFVRNPNDFSHNLNGRWTAFCLCRPQNIFFRRHLTWWVPRVY